MTSKTMPERSEVSIYLLKDEWKPNEAYEAFHQKYNPLDDGHASERFVKEIIK